MPENRSLSYSIMVHAGLFLIAAFGLPALFPRDHEMQPTVITVDILPISALTNVRPSDQPIQKEPTPTPPKQNDKPTPPQVKEPPKPVEEKHFDPTENAEPAPIKKPPPKDQPDFNKVLQKLQAEAAQSEKNAKDKAPPAQNTTNSNAPYDESLPLSLSDKDAIRNQFIKCWRMPAGAKDPASLAVRIRIQLNPDGTLIAKEMSADQLGRYNSDSFFKAAADAALRAVDQCTQPPLGPLKDLPADKYGSWRDMELNFDPKEMAGVLP